jgi:hypothetical protein
MLKVLEQKQITEFSLFVALHVTVKKEILKALLWKSNNDIMAVMYGAERTNGIHRCISMATVVMQIQYVILYAHCLLCSF